MEQKVVISGLSRAQVLAALYNAAAPKGLGFLRAAEGPKTMTVDQAQEILDKGAGSTPDNHFSVRLGASPHYFNYLYGRCLNIDLEDGISLLPYGYDRGNGVHGLMQWVISRVLETGDVNLPEFQELHTTALDLNAHEAAELANTVTSPRDNNTIKMGAADVGSDLMRAVDEEMERTEE